MDTYYCCVRILSIYLFPILPIFFKLGKETQGLKNNIGTPPLMEQFVANANSEAAFALHCRELLNFTTKKITQMYFLYITFSSNKNIERNQYVI